MKTKVPISGLGTCSRELSFDANIAATGVIISPKHKADPLIFHGSRAITMHKDIKKLVMELVLAKEGVVYIKDRG